MTGDLTRETALLKKIFERLVQFNTEYKHALIFSYQSKSGQVFFGTRNAKEKLFFFVFLSLYLSTNPGIKFFMMIIWMLLESNIY